MVESQPSKLLVAGSIPVSRSRNSLPMAQAARQVCAADSAKCSGVGMGDMFQQAALPVKDPAVFEPVKAALEAIFAPPAVGKFLERVARAKLRVRDFDEIRERGMLGETVQSGYAQLGDSDRGQIRELYLRSVEQVAPELRKKYLKVYAYY